jgi:DNA-binding NarL/FixJ family response regulator
MCPDGSAQPVHPPPTRAAVGPLRVLVVDDHDLFRTGLCGLLAERGFEIVGDAPDGESAAEKVRWLRPDVVVVALDLSGLSGPETARRLAEALPGVRIVGFLVTADPVTVSRAVGAGVHSYLMKDAGVEEIVDGIRLTAAGESVLSPSVATLILSRLRAEPSDRAPAITVPLTGRECEVLPLLVEGKSNVEIAAALFISPRTVKNHIARILAKLGAENRIQAAVEAVRRGLA